MDQIWPHQVYLVTPALLKWWHHTSAVVQILCCLFKESFLCLVIFWPRLWPSVAELRQTPVTSLIWALVRLHVWTELQESLSTFALFKLFQFALMLKKHKHLFFIFLKPVVSLMPWTPGCLSFSCEKWVWLWIFFFSWWIFSSYNSINKVCFSDKTVQDRWQALSAL